MTAQTLYNQLVQGDISEAKFLYEVRRDPRLTMITKFNSLKDTIQILKTKSVITESKDVMPKYKADKTIPLPEIESFTIDMVSPYEYGKGINYELELTQLAVGQNMPTEEEMVRTQKKVLKNLTSDPYYYTKKCYSDAEKKSEKENLRPEELKKDNNKAPNQLKKASLKENLEKSITSFINNAKKGILKKKEGEIMKKVNGFDLDLFLKLNPIYKGKEEDINKIANSLKENLEGEECSDCERAPELDLDELTPQQRKIVGKIVEEWGLTEYDLEDDDVLEEIAIELNKITNGKYGMEEAVAVKDAAGNIQYAKDDNEATTIMNNARTKGVQLTKSRV